MSYHYKDSHKKDKAVSGPFYLYVNPYTWLDVFLIEARPPRSLMYLTDEDETQISVHRY